MPAGSDGLLFLPYLTGERSPHPDPLARGAFVGLTVGHERRHLTRAVLEGVAFGLRDGLDLMVAAGMPAPTTIRASGGGTASPVWRQILADVLEAEIATVATTEGAAYGAGVLAAVGGAAGSRRCRTRPTPGSARPSRPTPGPDAATYRERHAVYRGLYPALAPTFHRTRGLDAAPAGVRRPREPRQPSSSASSFSVTSPGFLPRMIIAEDLVGGDVVLVDRVDDLAVVHDADPVGQVVDVVDVVADQEDPDALVLELPDEVRGPGRSPPGRGPRSARP